jgi:hypothetical protein
VTPSPPPSGYVVIDFDAVRAIGARLPGAEEGTWYGSPAFRVRGTVFVRQHEVDPDLVLIKVGLEERDALVGMMPQRFSKTEHRSEKQDSVLMRMSATTTEDLEELTELITEAWRRVAPPAMVDQFDAAEQQAGREPTE